MEPNLYADKKH